MTNMLALTKNITTGLFLLIFGNVCNKDEKSPEYDEISWVMILGTTIYVY